MAAGLFVECVDGEGAAVCVAPWRDLSARALEANVFAEPGFLIPAARHIAPRGLEFLFVWQDVSKQRLLGVMALEPSRGFLGVVQVWQSEQAGLAAIVLDRDHAVPALESALEWLARERPSVSGLYVPSLAALGETARLVEAVAARLTLRVFVVSPRERAVLPAASEDKLRFERALPGKRLKEWRRLRRRLDERGGLVLRSTGDPAELADAVERFLALEPKSWKGRGGAPLVAEPERAAFARSMLSSLAAEGKLRIDSLENSGAPIAMGVVLFSTRRAFYWKTAYDEAFAEFSPGVLLTLDLSRKQQDDPMIEATDSCAIEGHPMIDRLWPQRLALVDCLLAIRPGAFRPRLWLAQIMLIRRLKEAAKSVLFPLIGRKRS